MTLDEAIKHCEEKAEELRKEAERVRDIGEVISNSKQPYNEPVKYCRECAKEHEQLAEWLKDYKRLLEMPKGDLISRSALKKAVIEQVTHTTVDGHLAKNKAIQLNSAVKSTKIDVKE